MIGEDASSRMFAAPPGDPGRLITVLAAGAGDHLRSVFTNMGWHPGSSISILHPDYDQWRPSNPHTAMQADDHIELSTPSIAQH